MENEMSTYGYEITAYRPGGEYGAIVRKEVDAPDRDAARALIGGWLAVEGYDVSESFVVSVTEGQTFLEAGKERAMNFAAALSLEFGAAVIGPIVVGYDDKPGCAVRVIMSNGYGVSLTTGGPYAYDSAPAVGWIAVREDGDALRYHDFPGAMGDTQRGSTLGTGDLDEIREVMRKLPQPRK